MGCCGWIFALLYALYSKIILDIIRCGCYTAFVKNKAEAAASHLVALRVQVNPELSRKGALWARLWAAFFV